MRGDVVNNRGRLDPALHQAHEAQRVLAQELLARLLPLVAVAPLRCRLVAGAPTAGLHRLHAAGVQHGQRTLQCLELGHKDAACLWPPVKMHL